MNCSALERPPRILQRNSAGLHANSKHRMSTRQEITRIGSIDAYRGFVMFLMMAEVLHLRKVAQALPGSTIWSFSALHQTHVEWAGCSLHDLIQPSFSFLVGVALPFSLASRMARGQSTARMIWHALWRACVLTLLGVFLRSAGKRQTYWTFEDTLSQIGLGYVPLFLVGLLTVGRTIRSESELGPESREGGGTMRPLADLAWGLAALAVILIGYWGAFAVYPIAGRDFDYASLGVPADWSHLYSGFAGHWNKNSNLAWAFDTWFLNLFPREKPFTHNGGGYATLSFIPTLGTMLLGLIAGEWLRREPSDRNKLTWLILAGLLSLVAGSVLDSLAFCPSVKRIWTPAWTLFSGGWCFLILGAFYWLIDVANRTAWAFPLRVIGMNSIAAYCIAHLWDAFIIDSFKIHLGSAFFKQFGSPYEPIFQGAAVLLVYWLILFWMYRRKIFLRI